jgi:integrase
MPNLTARMVESLKPGDRMLTISDASTRGLEVYVTKAGAKTFSLRYSLTDGTRRRMNLGRWPDLGLADARQMAMAIMSQVALGQDPAHQRKIERSDSRTRTIRTFDDLAEALFEAAPSAGVRGSTLGYWKWLHAKHLKPRLGSTRLHDLAPGPVRRELREIGSEAGPTTSNRAHGLLRRVLNFGVEEEHIPSNPLAKVKALFDEKSRARVLTDKELKALWEAAERTQEPSRKGTKDRDDLGVSRAMAIAILLCLVTVQRGGEVSGMRTSELDFEARTWLLSKARTKANREHLVPLSQLAIDLIQEAQRTAAFRIEKAKEDKKPEELELLAKVDWPIFPSPRDPTKPIERLSLTRAMARLIELAEIENATPHDLRRTAATLMASERIGALTEVVARILNHAPPGLGVTGIYNRHAYVAEKRRAMEAWERLVQAITGSELPPSNILLFHQSHPA